MAASTHLHAQLVVHSTSKWPIVIAFAWGLAEATAFFIVPDVYLGLVALFSWRQGWRATLAAIAGATLGGAVMYVAARSNPAGLNLFLTHIPLINARMVGSLAAIMHSDGLISMINGPLRGVPYKVYAVEAGVQALPFPSFVAMTIPARLERFLPVTLAAGAAGKWLKGIIENHTLQVVGAYALFWGVIYFLYFLRFR